MRDESGETALHKAAFNGHVECCKACLDQGVSVNTKYAPPLSHLLLLLCSLSDPYSSSPLILGTIDKRYLCIWHASMDFQIVSSSYWKTSMISIPVSPLPLSLLHFTSLHFTSLHFTSLHFTSLHFTSLHFTSLHFTLFFFLFHPFRASINAKDADGETPLHYAALNGHLDCVRFLLKDNADVNLTDAEGSTPLHKVTSLFSIFTCFFFVLSFLRFYLTILYRLRLMGI